MLVTFIVTVLFFIIIHLRSTLARKDPSHLQNHPRDYWLFLCICWTSALIFFCVSSYLDAYARLCETRGCAKRTKCVNQKRLLFAAHQWWLAPCGVPLISWITGCSSSYRNCLRVSVAFFPLHHLHHHHHHLLCSLNSTTLSPLLLPLCFPSVHLSLASRLPRCYAGSQA